MSARRRNHELESIHEGTFLPAADPHVVLRCIVRILVLAAELGGIVTAERDDVPSRVTMTERNTPSTDLGTSPVRDVKIGTHSRPSQCTIRGPPSAVLPTAQTSWSISQRSHQATPL